MAKVWQWKKPKRTGHDVEHGPLETAQPRRQGHRQDDIFVDLDDCVGRSKLAFVAAAERDVQLSLSLSSSSSPSPSPSPSPPAIMRDATTPPPPSAPLRTPPTPKHGAGYHSYDPYSVPRRSQRVLLSHKNNDKDTKAAQSSFSSQKSTLSRTESSHTLSPPSSPAVHLPTHQQTPARLTPARQSLFTRNRPANTNNNNTLFDVFPTHSSFPTPVSMAATPHKTPRKLDAAALKSTARILNFKPTTTKAPMIARKKAKSRLTLDEDDVHEDVNIFTDVQDRVPAIDTTEDNPFVGPRCTTRASTAPPSSMDVDMDDAHTKKMGMFYVFRGKKIWRTYDDKNGEDAADSDASTGSNDSLKRQAGAAASRPLTRTKFVPRLLFPPAASDNDADEEAMTDIEEEIKPIPTPALFGAAVQAKKTPSKRVGAHPATPPSSHRQLRSAAEQISVFEGPHHDLNHVLASPSATPMPKRVASPPLFAGWSRAKDADEKAPRGPRGEKRHRVTMSEPDVPAKRARNSLFSDSH
ncbi:hypothetical protein D6D04_09733 [Aureobasidium pullulans]|nr:hypothetical protein D6D04_09733 [Aureobasidium pullulans]